MPLLRPNKHGIYCFCRENDFVLLVVRWKEEDPALWFFEEHHLNAVGQSMLWDMEEFNTIDDAVTYLSKEKSDNVKIIYW